MKMECDYLYGWVKKKPKQTVTYLEMLPKMVNPRDLVGNAAAEAAAAEEEEEEEDRGNRHRKDQTFFVFR